MGKHAHGRRRILLNQILHAAQCVEKEVRLDLFAQQLQLRLGEVFLSFHQRGVRCRRVDLSLQAPRALFLDFYFGL
ncbi:hypothetical protein PQR53_00745 [Paraburkholderia fungorum]